VIKGQEVKLNRKLPGKKCFKIKQKVKLKKKQNNFKRKKGTKSELYPINHKKCQNIFLNLTF